MPKIAIFLSRIAVILSLFLISQISTAGAENLKGKWVQGLRAGFSILSQDVADRTEGDSGPIINYNISYGLTDLLLMGIHIDWERHSIKDRPTGFYFGDESTLSIMPAIEYHVTGASTQQLVNYTPYILAGLGVNLNSFSESGDLKAACAPITCKIDPKNSFALKIGGGMDYFITSNLALNGELDWKLNNGTADISGTYLGMASTANADNKVSVLSVVFGARFYY